MRGNGRTRALAQEEHIHSFNAMAVEYGPVPEKSVLVFPFRRPVPRVMPMGLDLDT